MSAEFKIRNEKYMDKWPNSLTSAWPCTKVYSHFVDLVLKRAEYFYISEIVNFGRKMANGRLLF